MRPLEANPPSHLRLAGVTRLHLAAGRGPSDVYVFDPHRLALPCWALALADGPPALLVTLDRHLDLVPPVTAAPPRADGLRALDEYARWSLDVRSYDHVLAAMEAGLVTDAVVVARAKPRGAVSASSWTDRHGVEHRLVVAPTVDRLSEGYGAKEAGPESQEVERLLAGASRVLLDIDLDCFTTPSDADPTTVVPWPQGLVREFLLPRDSQPFWSAVLQKTVALTLAREPPHCGGLIATGRLFEDVAQVLFAELLQAELP